MYANIILYCNSDVSYYTSSQTFNYAKNAYVQVIPDLTCSTTGSTSITYSLASYNGNTIPAWITINSSTGQLSITTPSPSTNTDYSFYISSTISGVSSAVNKLMTISISGCTASNWLICQSTDVSTWTTCNSGYTLSSGKWSINSFSQSTPSSSINDNEDLKIDSEVSKNFVITVFIVSCVILVISNTLFSTSMSSIWVMINQVQLYFLLFLTRAFIPDQIKKVTKPQNPGTNSEWWNYYKIKNKKLIMKLTNLYNYDGIKSFAVKPQIKLDCFPVI